VLRPNALALALLTQLLFVAASCGGSASTPSGTPVAPTNGSLTIRAFEWGFEPSNVILLQNQEVRIEFVNGGSTLHDLKIDGLDASGVDSKSNGGLSAHGDELFVASAGGKSGSLSFTPTKAGTFTFYCTISRHRQLGMKGTITVY